MKWLVVVVLAGLYGDGSQDVYVFKNQEFNSKEECVAHVQDPENTPAYVQQLMYEYGPNRNIQAVLCGTEQQIEKALSGIQA